MFEQLSGQFTSIFRKMRGKGMLTEEDVNAAVRDIRVALLEADVALPVVKQFSTQLKERAIGETVINSVSPSQQIVKIVHDLLIETLGSEPHELRVNGHPAVIMMVGLQGAGKTTSCAKLAHWIQQKYGKKIAMTSLDFARLAAQDQLQLLANQLSIPFIQADVGLPMAEAARRAVSDAARQQCDILILDTAGRLQTDEMRMDEVRDVAKAVIPSEIFLVADALIGQESVNVAQRFHDSVPLTGIIMTRMDGDMRGGALLSMRVTTGCPIVFVGTGEKVTALELFRPEQVASRILDMGDIVSLVEKAQEAMDETEAARLEARMRKGQFTLDDYASQLKTIAKMGGLTSILGMMPGMQGMKEKLKEAPLDEMTRVQLAIISSMTRRERRDISVLNASRRRRIALGSGRTVAEVNQLLKQYQTMHTMMKKMGGLDKKSLMRGALGKLLG